MNNFDKIIKDAVDGFEAPFDPTAWDKLSNQLSPMEDAFRNAVEGHEAPYNPSVWSAIKGQIGGTSAILSWVGGTAAVIGLVAGFVYFWPGNNESTNQTPLANNELNEDKTEILNTNQDHNNSIIDNPADLALEDNAVPEGNELNEENNIVAQTEDRSDMNNNVNPANSNHHDNNDVNTQGEDNNSTHTVVSANNGLDNADARQNIEVDAPEVNAVIMLSEYELCQGDAIVCSAKGQDAGVSYSWDFGDGAIGSGRSVNHEYETNGKFEVTLTIRKTSSNKILGTSTETIVVHELPKLDFSWDQQNVVIPTIDFINLSQPASDWAWHVNGQIISDEAQTAYTFREKGDYMVSLHAENDQGCENTLQKTVSIEDDYNLLAPTAFSPNGDNLNETFIPSALKIMDGVEFNMTVYNEGANLVYQTSNVNIPWDGSNQIDNTEVPDGAYIWVVNLKNKNGIMETYKGQVLVVR